MQECCSQPTSNASNAFGSSHPNRTMPGAQYRRSCGRRPPHHGKVVQAVRAVEHHALHGNGLGQVLSGLGLASACRNRQGLAVTPGAACCVVGVAWQCSQQGLLHVGCACSQLLTLQALTARPAAGTPPCPNCMLSVMDWLQKEFKVHAHSGGPDHPPAGPSGAPPKLRCSAPMRVR